MVTWFAWRPRRCARWRPGSTRAPTVKNFAAIRNFQSELRARLPASARHVVLDLPHAQHMRYAALAAFERIASDLAGGGGRLVLTGVSADFAEYLVRAGSHLRVFRESDRPDVALRAALAEREDLPRE